MNKKTHKTSTSKKLTDPYIHHLVKVRRHGYELEFRVLSFENVNSSRLYEGVITSSSENSPYRVGETFNVSANEIKYHIVLNK